jgi:hypothetical protein
MAKIGHQPRYDPAGLIPGQQARCGPPSRLRLEVDVGESLPVAVTQPEPASNKGSGRACAMGRARQMARVAPTAVRMPA